MSDVRDFSIILFIALATISAYLVFVGRIGGGTFGWCLLASAIAVILIRNGDRLEQLVLKRGDDEVLVQIKQVQREVFAKVEELQRVSAGVAAFTVDGVIIGNRFLAPETHLERMLRSRDSLERFLTDTGLEPDKRKALLTPINVQVDWDARSMIVTNVAAAWRLEEDEAPTNPTKRDAFLAQLRLALQRTDRLKGLEDAEQLLATKKFSDRQGIQDAIETYRRILIEERIPRIGAVDDLTRPPVS